VSEGKWRPAELEFECEFEVLVSDDVVDE
jgi:hypothetical protein